MQIAEVGHCSPGPFPFNTVKEKFLLCLQQLPQQAFQLFWENFYTHSTEDTLLGGADGILGRQATGQQQSGFLQEKVPLPRLCSSRRGPSGSRPSSQLQEAATASVGSMRTWERGVQE